MAGLTPLLAQTNRSSTSSTAGSNISSNLSSLSSSPSLASASSTSSSTSSSSYSSSTYRRDILQPHNIYIESAILDDEQWSRFAFAMGIPYADTSCATSETRRFAHKMQKGSKSKSRLSERQITDNLHTLVQAAVTRARSDESDKLFTIKNNTQFHSDVASLYAPEPQMPTPKPSLTVGFTSKTFSPHEHELQTGLISTPSGLPCDLTNLSQPTPDCFWPFFLVEVHNESLHAAHNAAASSAATCDTALSLLTRVAADASIHRHGRSITWTPRQQVQSFSLSVSGTLASLNLHQISSGVHRSAMIRAYSLDDEKDVEALFSRLVSITVWAANMRLPRIVDLLENLDKIVKLEERYEVDYDNSDMLSVMSGATGRSKMSFASQRSRGSSGGLRSMLSDISPKWMRVHG